MLLGLLHTRAQEPVTISLQALSLVEKVEPIRVQLTLRLRDQRSMWMKDGCKIYMDSYMASTGLCFMVTWIVFINHLSEIGLTHNQETRPWHSACSQPFFYFIVSCVKTAWIDIHWNSISLSPITYDFTLHSKIRDRTTWFWRCVGTTFGHFLLGSHNSMVTVLGSCVKRPLYTTWDDNKDFIIGRLFAIVTCHMV
jgi:hypothetical protein